MNARFLVLVLVVSVIATASIGTAQEATEPSVTVSGATIHVDVGETSTVHAEYQVVVESTGSGDAELTALAGRLWKFDGRQLSGLSATVDGEEVSPTVDERSGHVDVSLPVDDVQDGDRVTVVLDYQVEGPANHAKVPLWVPNYQTAGEERVIEITTTLQEGQHVRGDTMPKPDRVSDDGRTLHYSQLHMPAFISVSYGDQPTLVSTGQLMSIIGIAVILGFMGSWLAYNRGYIGSKGGKANGA